MTIFESGWDLGKPGSVRDWNQRYMPSRLRGETYDNLSHINIGRLLDCERNGTSDCIRGDRDPFHGARDLCLRRRIGDGIRKVRLNEAQ